MPDLSSLYRLHEIDSALYSLRQEAAALDIGKADVAKIAEVAEEYKGIGGRATELTREVKDREQQEKAFADRLASLNKRMYDGSLVSPKDIANAESEIETLKTLTEKNDERLMELYDEAPPVLKEAEDVKDRMTELEQHLSATKAQALERHGEIKAEFDRLVAGRSAAAKEVDPDVIDKYEEVRKQIGGVGLAEVSDVQTCGQCGMIIPERTLEMIQAGRIIQCEGCHRILFESTNE
ncbi:MAG: hypothetical protein IH945_03040 [Armatimonadetes bacterium]|nr:hypothetical protein [Armatimonadota bacterium]